SYLHRASYTVPGRGVGVHPAASDQNIAILLRAGRLRRGKDKFASLGFREAHVVDAGIMPVIQDRIRQVPPPQLVALPDARIPVLVDQGPELLLLHPDPLQEEREVGRLDGTVTSDH